MKAAEYIPEGSFLVARKLFSSKIWLRDSMYLKVWFWILGKANFVERKKDGKIYRRGEFATTYDELIKACGYYCNRKRILPTLKQIRVILGWLKSEGMIQVEPLRREPVPTGADTKAETRAYIGIRIVVVNYDTYQDLETYKGRHPDRNLPSQGHYSKNVENDKRKAEKVSAASLREFLEKNPFARRYSNPQEIESALAAIISTRKSKRVSGNILQKILSGWERYPAEQVLAGIHTYLDKSYADHGKDERYLAGIIRNSNGKGPQSQEPTTGSGSRLYDEAMRQCHGTA